MFVSHWVERSLHPLGFEILEDLFDSLLFYREGHDFVHNLGHLLAPLLPELEESCVIFLLSSALKSLQQGVVEVLDSLLLALAVGAHDIVEVLLNHRLALQVVLLQHRLGLTLPHLSIRNVERVTHGLGIRELGPLPLVLAELEVRGGLEAGNPHTR